MGVHWKMWFLQGAWQFADLGEGAWQKRVGCFWGRVDSPMHTMVIFISVAYHMLSGCSNGHIATIFDQICKHLLKNEIW